jgi:hypothetical protein
VHIRTLHAANDSAPTIATRREAAGYTHLDSLPDDPAGLIAWVCTHQDAPDDVLAADALDALDIIYHLRVTLDRQELTLLRTARKAGVTWQRIALVLHLRSRQAAQQRALRLDSLQAGEGRSERTARERHAGESAEATWLLRNRNAIHAAARAVASEFPTEATDLAEVLHDPASTSRELIAWLSLSLADLNLSSIPASCRDAARAIDAWHRVRYA